MLDCLMQLTQTSCIHGFGHDLIKLGLELCNSLHLAGRDEQSLWGIDGDILDFLEKSDHASSIGENGLQSGQPLRICQVLLVGLEGGQRPVLFDHEQD